MLTETEIIAKLKDTGVTTSWIMQRQGITHTKALEILNRLGAYKAQTGVPSLWRMPGTAPANQWTRGPAAAPQGMT